MESGWGQARSQWRPRQGHANLKPDRGLGHAGSKLQADPALCRESTLGASHARVASSCLHHLVNAPDPGGTCPGSAC